MILDMVKKMVGDEKVINDSLMERATKVYKKQKGALLDIKNTHGIAEIMRWLRAEKDRCEKMFSGYSGSERLEGEYHMTCRLLRYLENMFNEEEIKDLEAAIKEFDKV